MQGVRGTLRDNRRVVEGIIYRYRIGLSRTPECPWPLTATGASKLAPGNAAGAGVVNRGQGCALVRGDVADRQLAWGLAPLAAVGYGLLAGWWTPRGPMST